MKRKFFRIALPLFLFLFSFSSLTAQEDGADVEIVLQKFNQEKELYEDFFATRASGAEEFIEIEPLLKNGWYRYKIRDSEWIEFSYFEERRPELESVASEATGSNVIYIDGDGGGKITVLGKNLFRMRRSGKDDEFTAYRLVSRGNAKGSRQIILRGKTDLQTLPFDGKRNALESLDYELSDGGISLLFDFSALDAGSYYLVAQDASGNESDRSKSSLLKVRYKKSWDLNLSLGYNLPIILYDNLIPDNLGSSVFPLSFFGRATFIPVKKRLGSFGLGLTGTYTRLLGDTAGYKADGNLITCSLNAVYQLPIFLNAGDLEKRAHKFTVEFHAGFGFVCISDFKFDYKSGGSSPAFNSIDLSFDFGTAFQYFFTKNLYGEGLLDFITSYGRDSSLGILYPGLSCGWQL